MADDRTSKIPLFEGKDFGLWKRRITIALRQRRAQIAIEQPDENGRKPTSAQEDEAQHIIFNNLGNEVAKKVLTCTTAEEIWKRLLKIYENADRDNVDQLLENYYTYRKDERDDMSTHIGKVERLASQLSDVKQEQTEESIMSKLLGSLPEGYNSLKEAWRSVHPDLKTRENLIARLIKYDIPHAKEKLKSEVALVTRDNNVQNRRKREIKKKIRCFKCNRMGFHMAKDCRSSYDETQPQRKPEEKARGPNLAMIVGNEELDKRWIVDSAASRHISCHREWFSNYRECSEELMVGNQEFVKAVGEGSVIIQCAVGSIVSTITLQNVLYIPEMSHNLFYTGRATKTGAKVLIDSKGCQVLYKGETVAVGTVDQTNNITTLNAKTISGVAMLVSTKRTMEEWHQSLGHVDQRVIREMVANRCVDGLEIIDPPKGGCEACPSGKGTRASHTGVASIRVEKVGDAIDMDLIGPINEPSLGGRRYMLLARDRFSNYSHIGILRTKDEVSSKLQDYIGMFEAESGVRIRNIYTDNGSEFSNEKVKTLCSIEHIKLVFSAPYTPEQNGGAERNNRTIISTIRTMLTAKSLPTKLWGEAAMTAVYLRNRVPRRGQKKTPYETFVGRKPFVGHLVPFGTPVHSLVNDRKLGKFDSRTEPGIIVGYTQRSNTYRLYIQGRDCVKVTCDVIFRGHCKTTIGQDGEQSSPRAIDVYFENIQMGNEGLDTSKSTAQEGARSSQPTREQINPERQAEQSETLEDDDVEAPSFSTLTGGEESPEPEVSYSYPDLEQIEHISPFQGRTLQRTPTKPRDDRTSGTIMMCTKTFNEPPQTFAEAIRRPEKRQWWDAVKTEIRALDKNKTWQIVKRPENRSLLTTKWVFTEKRDSAGRIERWKARLVVRGFQQREGIDYTETFAPVVRNVSIRVLLALAAAEGQTIERFDVSTAFLNGQIEEEVFVEIPEGINGNKTKECLKLSRALYGLKQAPRVWNSVFNQTVKELGFQPTEADPCVYINKKTGVKLAVYVDDGLVIGKKQQDCIQVIEDLNKHFEVKRINGEMFLGMQLTKVQGGLHLNQSRYIIDILNKFNMAECQPEDNPLVDAKILFKKEGKPANVPYRTAIGCLLYLAQATRPDILYPTVLLAKFSEQPLEAHWPAIMLTFVGYCLLFSHTLSQNKVKKTSGVKYLNS